MSGRSFIICFRTLLGRSLNTRWVKSSRSRTSTSSRTLLISMMYCPELSTLWPRSNSICTQAFTTDDPIFKIQATLLLVASPGSNCLPNRLLRCAVGTSLIFATLTWAAMLLIQGKHFPWMPGTPCCLAASASRRALSLIGLPHSHLSDIFFPSQVARRIT